MKIFTVIGGLGSQMLKYAFLLQIKSNCNDDCYVDDISHMVHHSWYGYELEKVFDIRVNKISSLFTNDELNNILRNSDYKQEMFYLLNKKYKQQIIIYNLGVKNIWNPRLYIYQKYFGPIITKISIFIRKFFNFEVASKNKNTVINIENTYENLSEIYFSKDIIYIDEFCHNSDKYFKSVKSEIKRSYEFKFELSPKLNKVLETIKNTNSISIHLRRTDHMYDNDALYESDYFTKSIDYIKENVLSPVFFIFSDDIEYCYKEFIKIFNEVDQFFIIDNNRSEMSYIDLYLMKSCKHYILSISSFGWWGQYLNDSKNKIVCAPIHYWEDATIHF